MDRSEIELPKIILLAGSVGIGKNAAACVKVIDDCWRYEDNYGVIMS